MPVTFPVANVAVRAYVPPESERQLLPNDPSTTILNDLRTSYKPKRLLKSSIDGKKTLLSKNNGFVNGVVAAYNRHHKLVIRPDDVWISILSQLNFYINAHAEELRDKFVAHEEKKELIVKCAAASIETMPFGTLAVQMTGEIDKNVKDKTLIPWVIPNFSTTTTTDTIVCSVLIMTTLKAYFSYTMMATCGIPFITLEGTQADWQSILDRIDKIPEFGKEPTEWAAMLRAILKHFVNAFNDGGPQADKAFWERMVHQTSSASSVPYVSGWICAFCAWNSKGVFFKAKTSQRDYDTEYDAPEWVIDLRFDEVWFPRVDSIPEGYGEVDVSVIVGGKEHKCAMVAGHVGIVMEGEDEKKLDTVRISPQWFIYVKSKESKSEKE